MNKCQKVVLCLVLSVILLIGWWLFPLFFKWLMVGIGSKEADLNDYGSLGDIYGSLNTLFTSATLIIVMYSAYLQRQANQDARQAMQDQLQQARDDTENQLQQAREATQKQIEHAKNLADIQLSHSMAVSTQQLELAQATHREQLNESQISIFNSQFFSLLNFKNDYYKQMKFNKTEDNDSFTYVADEFFEELAKTIKTSFRIFVTNVEEMDSEYLDLSFNSKTSKFFENMESYTLYSYFRNYVQLLKLINDSILSETEKKRYRTIVANSMNYYEQVTLFFIIPMFEEFQAEFKNSEIFSHFWGERYTAFALKYYDESYFNLPKWNEFFNNQKN
ncbi:hypothetical protein [Acinetobacter bereziniae]|uniref:hypothetical protein n=1 Tax=Acinetobacter bereziniae TaxID=106648 RepID=UPI0021E4F1AA|nr:hypothetical protein [Acinetobacter bereziniae]MCV2441909.1 hypothetical protein [Acinetobacter bereziniae]